MDRRQLNLGGLAAGATLATRFEGTSPVIPALAAGELDIGSLAFSSFALAIQNAAKRLQ